MCVPVQSHYSINWLIMYHDSTVVDMVHLRPVILRADMAPLVDPLLLARLVVGTELLQLGMVAVPRLPLLVPTPSQYSMIHSL